MITDYEARFSCQPENDWQRRVGEEIVSLLSKVDKLKAEYERARQLKTFDKWLRSDGRYQTAASVPCRTYGLTEPPHRLSLVAPWEIADFHPGEAPMVMRGARCVMEDKYRRKSWLFEEVVARWVRAKKLCAFTRADFDELRKKYCVSFKPKRHYVPLYFFTGNGCLAQEFSGRDGLDNLAQTFLFNGRLMTVDGKTKEERKQRIEMMLFTLKTAKRFSKDKPLLRAA